MRIIIEVDSDSKIVKKKATRMGHRFHIMRAVPALPYVVRGQVCPPIIYTPTISTGPGGPIVPPQQYQVHVYSCSPPGVTDPAQYVAIPYVQLPNPALPTTLPASQQQVQFNTQGVSTTGTLTAFQWYQTINLTPANGVAPIRHLLYNPAPANAPINEPIATLPQVDLGSSLQMGVIGLSGTASPLSVVYYEWRSITDGTNCPPTNFFLQQPSS